MNSMDGFEFSQSSLQDYVDCRRRFQLRYLQRVAWPAIPAEPARENERHIQRGERFHRLAQQYLLGIPEAKLTRMAEADEDHHLRAWWDHFLEAIPPSLNGVRHVEVSLSALLEGHRLLAKYDLLLIQSDAQIVIYDWKTASHRPRRDRLSQRLQTRVYPYLLVKAGSVLNNRQPIAPDSVSMIYWFSDPQMEPETFKYSHARFKEDEQHLRSLVAEISGLSFNDFSQAASEAPCRYCVYRSLCNRGSRAAEMGSEDQPEFDEAGNESLDFNLEQIGEISF